MPSAIEVRKVPIHSVTDASELTRLIDEGVIAADRVFAIIGKTEEYFCPIKHARRILGSHARYKRFLDYGDAADYEGRLEEFRRNLDDTPKP